MAAVPVSILTKDDIEIASRAADQFTRIYYSAYDSNNRVSDIPAFYRADSKITWNGNPYSGPDGIRSLMENMPETRHEVQCFDCHPIPGSQPPSLLVTVSGNVMHGSGPRIAKVLDTMPRVFSQIFVLVPDPTAPPTKPGEIAKYYVCSDVLRFVG